ncbi:MAG: hypothetical protein WEC33_04755 [Dehalococcoidia bacterium]
MLRRFALVLPLTALLALATMAGCGDGDDDDDEPTPTGEPTATAGPTDEPTAEASATPTEGPFEGTLGPVEEQAIGGEVATLLEVRVGEQSTYDRIVFEFNAEEGVPGFKVEYVVGPIGQCASGFPVDVDGAALVLISLRTVQAHNDDGTPTILNPDIPAGLGQLNHAVQVCDIEGLVQWGIGLNEQTMFRVLKLEDPPRIVVDFQH